MSVKFSNNATTELASSIGTSDTSITVVDGSKFPILTAGDYTYVTLDTDTASPTREIVRVTAISGNVLTVTRGQDGTSPASFAAGTKVELRLTAALLNDVAGANPSGEPIGFPDKSQTTITFDSGIRTFSITPTGASFDVYCKGVKYTYTTVQLVTIPNTTGLHFIYFSASGVLSTQMSYFTWAEHAPTAYVYWNATTQQAVYFGDERHGITLDWQTHEYLHRTRGAAIANGFLASGYTLNSSATNAATQIAIESGTFFDEDMKIDIVSTATPTAGTFQQNLLFPAKIPVLHLQGTSWVMDAPTDFPFKQGTSRPQYNSVSGGVWSTADVGNNQHATTWILATNNLTYPVIAIIGQSATDNLGEAEAFSFADLTLPGFPSVEFRPLYKLIYKASDGYANSVNARLESIVDLRSISAVGAAANPATDHGNLSGLSDDDHPQYVHTSEVRTPSAAVKNSFFPSQVGQTGKYLSTDGTNTVWEPAPSGSLSFTGDVTGTGSTGSSVSLTLAASGVVAGQYTKVTVDSKGRVTAGTGVTSADVTSALGYTPYNATNPAGYTTNVGTVTSVSGTGTVSGLTLTGSVTSSGSLTLGGTLSLTSGQVTTGLGYTPYNATNPSGYISGNQTITVSGDASGSGATSIALTLANSGVAAGTYTKVTVDAKGRVTTGASLASGDLPTYTGTITSGQVTTALGFTPYNATNPSGYTNNTGTVTSVSGTGTVSGLTLTGTVTGSGSLTLGGTLSLTSGQVTTALGYTPYNSSNPSGYITSSSNITGNAATVSSITGNTGLMVDRLTPSSTIDGLTTSNFRSALFGTTTNAAAISAARWNTPPSALSGIGHYGTMIAWAAADTQGFLALDYNSAIAKIGGGNGNNINWSATLLHSSNYGSYALPLSGGTVSGNLSVTGTINGVINTTAPGGSVLIKHSVSETDAWIFQENAANWGLYWKNAPSGNHTFGGYTSVGAELVGMSAANASGNGVTTSNFVGATSAIAQWMISNYTGYIWSASTVYAAGSMVVGGNTVLHAANYNSYALPLSGGTLTGTTTLSSGQFNLSAASQSISTTTPGTTLYSLNFTGQATPDYAHGITWGWASSGAQAGVYVQSSGGYGTKMYLATTDSFATGAKTAVSIDHSGNVNIARGALTQGGNQVLHAGNYSSYSAFSGLVTSSGNNGFANATWFASVRNPIWSFGNSSSYGISYFQGSAGRDGSDTITLHPNGSTTATGAAFAVNGNNAFAFNNVILHAGNFSSYAVPARTRSSWNDNTVINNVVGQLAWKNYGGSHTIFDASASTAPDGTAVDRTNSAVAWSGSYPTLMGWNGASTYGVRVDSARVSDTVGGLTPAKFFNNMGNNHSTYTDFNNVPDFGAYYVQAGTNSPTGVGSHQWYGFTLGLGNDYAQSSYASQLYWPRRAQNSDTYIYVRDREGGGWSSWSKIKAGYADNSNNLQGYQWASAGKDVRGSQIYVDNWFRNYNSGTGLYNEATANHWYSDGQYWNVGYSGTTGIRLRNGHSGTILGYLYGETSGNFGLLHNGGGWAVQVYPGGGGNLHGGFAIGGNTPLTSANYTSYAPSYSSGGTFTGIWYFNSSRDTSSNSPPLQAFSSGGSGAIMSFHRGGYYAVNMGLDSDNVFRIGGWSAANNRLQMDMSGNLTMAGLIRSGNNVYIDQNYGHGHVGLYESTRYQGVFFMGDAYKMSADGTSLANMYGIGWSHPNAGGAAGNLTDHGMLIINNGSFRCAISNSIVASGNITAYSDERLKKNWRDMPDNFVERLSQVRVGRYERIDDGTQQVGVSAQSLQPLLPEAIQTAKDEIGTLSVSYGNAAMASAVELAKELVMLKRELAEIKSRLH